MESSEGSSFDTQFPWKIQHFVQIGLCLWQRVREVCQRTKVPPAGNCQRRDGPSAVAPGSLPEGSIMPHFPKPFYRKSRNRWAVQIDGKMHNLGAGKEEAFRLYHELMAQRGSTEPHPASAPAQATGTGPPLVAELLDSYLDWLKH